MFAFGSRKIFMVVPLSRCEIHFQIQTAWFTTKKGIAWQVTIGVIMLPGILLTYSHQGRISVCVNYYDTLFHRYEDRCIRQCFVYTDTHHQDKFIGGSYSALVPSMAF